MSIATLRRQWSKGQLTKADFIREAGHIQKQLFAFREDLDGQIMSITIERDRVLYRLDDEALIFCLSDFDDRVAPVEAINFGSYEPALWRVMRACCEALADSGDCIDVGANVGWYTMRIAKAFPSKRIFAVEPATATFRQLQANVDLNALKNVVSLQCALSEIVGSGFLVSETGSSVANHLLESAAKASTLSYEPESVRLTTLDILCDEQKITPAFVKADIEGAELALLRGGAATIVSRRPVIICELLRKWSARFGYHPNEVLNFLAKFGYSCWAIEENGVSPLETITDDTKETNFLFLMPERDKEILDRLACSF